MAILMSHSTNDSRNFGKRQFLESGILGKWLFLASGILGSSENRQDSNCTIETLHKAYKPGARGLELAQVQTKVARAQAQEPAQAVQTLRGPAVPAVAAKALVLPARVLALPALALALPARALALALALPARALALLARAR